MIGENWDEIKECIMKTEDKKQMQRNIQGKYRKVIKHKGKDKKTSKKEAIIVAIIVFLIIVLDALVKGF